MCCEDQRQGAPEDDSVVSTDHVQVVDGGRGWDVKAVASHEVRFCSRRVKRGLTGKGGRLRFPVRDMPCDTHRGRMPPDLSLWKVRQSRS